jgi:competence protein ComEC
MFDCGGSFDRDTADIATEYLQSKGIWMLDGLILSHYDRDHAGAAAMLMSRVPVKTLYLPDTQPEDVTRNTLEKKYGDRICWVKDDLHIPDGNISLFFNKDAASDNESCICVLFQPENCDILIMSDCNISVENELLDRVLLPELEILVAGNHGSKNATGLELLARTKPAVAVISVGKNYYGHPSEETLNRLENFGCDVYRTDRMGTLEFGR